MENIELKPWQRKAFDLSGSDKDGITICTPRGYGKTTLACVYAVDSALKDDNISIGYMCHNNNAVKYVVNNMRVTIHSEWQNIRAPFEFRFENGSTIEVLSIRSGAIQGKSFHKLIFDEHQLFPKDFCVYAMATLRPAIAMKFFSIGTPSLHKLEDLLAGKSHYYNLWMLNRNPDFDYYHVKGEDDPERLHVLDEGCYKREVLAKFS
jgi:phage terminase large subunit-like protein